MISSDPFINSPTLWSFEKRLGVTKIMLNSITHPNQTCTRIGSPSCTVSLRCRCWLEVEFSLSSTSNGLSSVTLLKDVSYRYTLVTAKSVFLLANKPKFCRVFPYAKSRREVVLQICLAAAGSSYRDRSKLYCRRSLQHILSKKCLPNVKHGVPGLMGGMQSKLLIHKNSATISPASNTYP